MWTPSVSLSQELSGVATSGLVRNQLPAIATTLTQTEITRRTRSLAI